MLPPPRPARLLLDDSCDGICGQFQAIFLERLAEYVQFSKLGRDMQVKLVSEALSIYSHMGVDSRCRILQLKYQEALQSSPSVCSPLYFHPALPCVPLSF